MSEQTKDNKKGGGKRADREGGGKGGEGKNKEGGKGKGGGKKGGKERTLSEKPENCKSVMVKNMSFGTNEDKLKKFFDDFLTPDLKSDSDSIIERLYLMRDRDTHESKGIAFLDFKTTD